MGWESIFMVTKDRAWPKVVAEEVLLRGCRNISWRQKIELVEKKELKIILDFWPEHLSK